LKILWISNHPLTNTGYGNQTHLFVDLLLHAGYEVVVFANWGQEGFTQKYPSGLKILPRLADIWGNDIALTHYSQEKPDIVVTLCNPLILNISAYGQMPWLAWAPVEGEPVRPDDVNVLRGAKRIWALSHTAEALFRTAGFDAVDYVPHGINSDLFKPIDRSEARKEFARLSKVDLTDTFLVSYVAANKGVPSRKGFYEGLKAFGEFKAKTGAKALFYLHTTDRPDYYGGEDLNVVRMLAGVNAEDVIFPHQYNYLTGQLPTAYLNMVYNASDIYFHPSHGEGFGIPIMEAQMAGCPVIVNDYATMGEIALVGYKAPYKALHQWNPGQLQSLPDVETLTNALITAYNERANRDKMGQDARTKALEFDHRAVFSRFMKPALDKFADEYLSKKVRRAKLRAAAREKAFSANGKAVEPVNG
jgi:glycosyltransferase involved in cell wall biosynthesis